MIYYIIENNNVSIGCIGILWDTSIKLNKMMNKRYNIRLYILLILCI